MQVYFNWVTYGTMYVAKGMAVVVKGIAEPIYKSQPLHSASVLDVVLYEWKMSYTHSSCASPQIYSSTQAATLAASFESDCTVCTV